MQCICTIQCVCNTVCICNTVCMDNTVCMHNTIVDHLCSVHNISMTSRGLAKKEPLPLSNILLYVHSYMYNNEQLIK